jgi:hypothetical protein
VRKREQSVLAAAGLASMSSGSPIRQEPLIDLPHARATSVRTPPAHLAAAFAGVSSEPMLKTSSAPTTGMLSARPNAKMWNGMSEGDRQLWLRDVESRARNEGGKTLIGFEETEVLAQQLPRRSNTSRR